MCRVFFCIVRVRVLPTDIVGEAAGVGVVVGNAAGVGVIVGDTAGADGITAGVCSASVTAGTCCGVGLFANSKHDCNNSGKNSNNSNSNRQACETLRLLVPSIAMS